MSPAPALPTLADVLRAESSGTDLLDGESCVIVCAQDPGGRVYEIGRVAWSLASQSPALAREAIARVKFARFRPDPGA